MAQAIEHGSSRGSRWMRERRIRVALWIAAFEGLLYLFGILHWWVAVALALIALGSYWLARKSRSDFFRQVTWTFAAAQLLVLLVPLALGILKAVAIAVIAIIAIMALIFLFTDRH
jgi:hypothetical protein